MTDAIEQALENIYTSIHNGNENLDERIAALKTALQQNGTDTVEVDSTRLVEPNRAGRKLMQSYFRKRGVNVTFAAKTAA